MARLDLDFQDVYSQVSDFLGNGTTPTGDDLTRVKNIVYRAYRQFLYPIHPHNGRRHTWSFLRKYYVFTTVEDKWKYTLPLDFDRMLDRPQYGEEEPYGSLDKTSTEQILSERAIQSFTSFPVKYALHPISSDPELGTMWEIWLWPGPNGEYTLHFPYLISPQKPENDDDVFLGGPESAETILEMSLAIAESQEENTAGVHRQEADRLLTQRILSDSAQGADYLGQMTIGPDQPIIRLGYVRYGTGTDYLYADDRS